MSNGYRVDLSALDEVIKRLNQIADNLGSPKSKAKYQTYLPAGWLGKIFQEEATFRNAHNELKADIESYVQRLEDLINDYGLKTKQVRDNYDKNEQATKTSMTFD